MPIDDTLIGHMKSFKNSTTLKYIYFLIKNRSHEKK